MNKEEAKVRIDSIINHLEWRHGCGTDYVESDRDQAHQIIDQIKPDHPKINLPREVGEELEDWLKTDNIDDILDKIVCIYDGDHSVVRNWWASTLGATYLIADMARYGWKAEKETLYNVKVPHVPLYYWKKPDGSVGIDDLTVATADDDTDDFDFTEAEIEQYGLQDCEKEEVTDDDD